MKDFFFRWSSVISDLYRAFPLSKGSLWKRSKEQSAEESVAEQGDDIAVKEVELLYLD